MPDLTVPGPCGDWTLSTDVCEDFDSFAAAVTGMAATTAVNWLWRLTGRRFGLCTTTIRPCGQRDLPGATYASGGTIPPGLLPGHSLHPVVVDGSPTFPAYACTTCRITSSKAALRLPYRVSAVTDVTIEGVQQDITEFAVLDHTMLVWRSPTDATFPDTQDLTAPDGDPNTWSVTLSHGTPPPADAKYALGILACEIAKARVGVPCALPRRVVSVARQGVNYQLVNGDDFLSSGLVGLTEVDQFIVSVNPSRLRQAPQIFSPDDVLRRPTETWIGS